MAELSNLDKRARKALAGVLEDSEELLVTQPGESSALVATNRRILICKWGATSGAFFGSQDQGPTSVWEAPNALFVSGNDGEATVAALRQMVADHHRRPGDDPADQIRKFAALRDDGIISDDEFQAKKRSILGI